MNYWSHNENVILFLLKINQFALNNYDELEHNAKVICNKQNQRADQ